MPIHPLPLILCSESKSKASLLRRAELEFEILPSHLDEQLVAADTPVLRTVALARAKIMAIKHKFDRPALFLGADTVVIFNNQVMEKPKYKMTAVDMLKKLSGSIHTMLTGWAIYNSYKNVWFDGYAETYVTFRKLANDEIIKYVNDNPVVTWAGGYNSEMSEAATFVSKVEGSLTGLNGLPLDQIVPILNQQWSKPYIKRHS